MVYRVITIELKCPPSHKHPFSLNPTCFSSQTESKKKQQDLTKQFYTSQVMYTLYNLYRIILTNTIFKDRYFRSINNQLRSKRNSFLSIRCIRLDDAVWYKDLAIIRKKVAFDSFFKSVVCKRNPSILHESCSKFVHH